MPLQKLHSGLKQASVVREKMAAAPQSQLLSARLQDHADMPAAVPSGHEQQASLDRQGSLPGQQLPAESAISKAISMPANHASLLRAYAADVCQSQWSPKASKSPQSPQRHILGMHVLLKNICECSWQS